ncbi:copper homeostasis protein CutC [Secundilactobacillus kimchicus]|uniref:Copper homeostasis protein cutC homolog n=1 Tax=Secundilactobacillus kimchicus JCM 15530 TaxID=1302272 RepID=A0A0R1HT04_9LACO|nr:copper homeostasis protein CutC [Secundilactobacillus kimchicus]KRK49558.1 copper resistance protein [Secundilactobacillus kimchicus JCM 15530]
MIKMPLIENATQLPELVGQAGLRHLLITDNLTNGGTTVSKGVMAESIRYAHENGASLDFVIRPRIGQAQYTDTELKIMEADILEAQQLGADGVVMSALGPDNTLDTDGLNNLIAAAGGMTLSFNHDLDTLTETDQTAALDWLAAAGFDRVLTTNFDHLSDRIKLAQDKGLSLVPISSSTSATETLVASAALNYVIEIQK